MDTQKRSQGKSFVKKNRGVLGTIFVWFHEFFRVCLLQKAALAFSLIFKESFPGRLRVSPFRHDGRSGDVILIKPWVNPMSNGDIVNRILQGKPLKIIA